ncbi:hypothetical protein [Polynucleobacter sp. 80A-SIGWE]|uniref:hypothetical protein n=1 Tax=Polynucleobacter sp. 80A-SIGWE TaxID=2689100 RepID=UPI001C0C5116|nr:hypothetical protein [Polynucleobacter sp. 80A-SIGWE]MBU3589079.1 hypothetical protein [Polynucleobacter sp. 80A-SIGWE]
MRKKFVTLCKSELALNNNSYVLLGDIGVGGFVNPDESLPDRVLNMGIAEQALIGFAAGLSAEKGNVIVHTIAPFLVERAYEQIKLNCGYNNKKIILISANGPFDYEKLGPTHHCPADVNLLSLIPNLQIRTPSTLEEFEICFHEAVASDLTHYIRLTSRCAFVENYIDLEDGWKKVSAAVDRPSDRDLAFICTGESLKFVMEECIDSAQGSIFYHSNPLAKLPNIISEFTNIKIYEPYLRSEFDLSPLRVGQNIERYLFDKGYKKIIRKNLGWEDFKK